MDPAQAKREALLEALHASGSADAVKAAVFDLYNSGPPDKKDAVAFVSKVLRAPGAPPQHLRKSWPAPPRGREDFLRFLDQSGLPHTIMRGVRALAKEDDAVLADKDAVFDAIKVALEKGVPKPKRVRPPEGSRRRPPLQGSAPPKLAPLNIADLAKPLDFADLDTDGDGKVSKEELEAYNAVVVKPARKAAGLEPEADAPEASKAEVGDEAAVGDAHAQQAPVDEGAATAAGGDAGVATEAEPEAGAAFNGATTEGGGETPAETEAPVVEDAPAEAEMDAPAAPEAPAEDEVPAEAATEEEEAPAAEEEAPAAEPEQAPAEPEAE